MRRPRLARWSAWSCRRSGGARTCGWRWSPRSGDLFLGYLAARDGAAAWYVPERLTRYRVHAASATAGRGTSFSESNVTARRLMLADPRTAALRAALGRALAGCEASLGLDLLALGRNADARPHLRASVGRRPAARSAVGLLLSALPAGLSRRLVRRLRAAP